MYFLNHLYQIVKYLIVAPEDRYSIIQDFQSYYLNFLFLLEKTTKSRIFIVLMTQLMISDSYYIPIENSVSISTTVRLGISSSLKTRY